MWTSPCDPLVEAVDGQLAVTCRRDGSSIASVVGDRPWSELADLVAAHQCADQPTTAPTVDAEDLTSREEDDPTGLWRLRARWKDLITPPDRATSEKDGEAGSAVLAAGVAIVCDTCSGDGQVYEEGQPGGHHGGLVPCPDCSCPECGAPAHMRRVCGGCPDCACPECGHEANCSHRDEPIGRRPSRPDQRRTGAVPNRPEEGRPWITIGRRSTPGPSSS